MTPMIAKEAAVRSAGLCPTLSENIHDRIEPRKAPAWSVETIFALRFAWAVLLRMSRW